MSAEDLTPQEVRDAVAAAVEEGNQGSPESLRFKLVDAGLEQRALADESDAVRASDEMIGHNFAGDEALQALARRIADTEQ